MAAGTGPVKHGFIENLIAYCAHNRFFVFIITFMLVAASLWSMKNVPLDAIPDLSDTQVIIMVQWHGRDPQLVEDQVTYPLVTSLLAAPNVKVVRGFSDFSMAYVYVIFEDGTDIYWARSRVLEYLSKLQGRLPMDAMVELGPDATGLGWVFQYALVDRTGNHTLADLRSYQDWNLRYALEGIDGVAEVAPVGGFVKSYQVEVDPNALAERGLSIEDVSSRIRNSNRDIGARAVEMAGREFIVRGIGYVKSKEQIADISVGLGPGGTPVRVRDIGRVVMGPDLRRGVAELDGEGEVVGGVVVIRYGENALRVIERVKERLEEVRPTLPEGVELVTVYDRSDLILRSIDTLKHTLTEEMIVVALVIIIFLWHLPSAAVPIVTIPTAVALSFIPMWYYGITSNIMSLGGIAVAVGALVDASIVVVENIHKKLERWEDTGREGSRRSVVLTAIQEVGRPSFFSLLIIAVSFIPVFALTGQEGRLFRPLAATKNLSMGIAAVLAVTLVPAICFLVFRDKEFSFRPRVLSRLLNGLLGSKIRREHEHPISRFLQRIYEPVCRFVLEWPKAIVTLATALVIVTVPVFMQLGSEFMPTLWEGSFLYMPSTAFPSASVESASRALRVQDKLIADHPAVKTVFGKVGRAVTATDPAPLTMVETTVTLKDEDDWPRERVERWYSGWAPDFLRPMLGKIWPEERTVSWRKVKTELDQKLQIPGWPNIWTMPIENRVNMLTTGIRAPVGVKIFGSDLATLDRLSTEIATTLRNVPGATSVVTEPILGAPYLNIDINRSEIARYGLTIEDVNAVLETALGGVTLTTTVEGRERYPIQLRYPRELRGDPERIRRVLIPTPSGAQIPLGEVAEVKIVSGPAMIKDEDGALAAYINVDFSGPSLGQFVTDAKAAVTREIIQAGRLPSGYRIGWSGQYEFQERANRRLSILVPVTLMIVFLLLYLNTSSIAKTLIVLVAVPFSAIGAVWFLWALDYNISVAVWVGLIALLGVDAETAIFMLLYLDLAYDDAKSKGKMASLNDLKEAIVSGAVMRVRPKFMTVATTFIGLLPVMWATGSGSDVMKRIAAPMIGGLASSFIMELLIYPAIFLLWKWWGEVRSVAAAHE